MDGWMDRWVGGWMDGWLDGWMGGWMDGWMVFSNMIAYEIVWMRPKLTTPAVLAGILPDNVMCKGIHGHQFSHRPYYPHWFTLNGAGIKIMVF